ncbi:helix-turn-helix domain-containing protein [Hymenobacter sp. HSC-4F20]|uniref:helix-turn-helix domain-containing protein n=1 Tax=Hymenobacter sp. HSC-4F20 TaxID=2864135 RepID=UPI001C730CC6|nr:helix-turn-helix domain-containing protein [Hymenobacter sp. HSC-4F20]MBX0291808.1 helix-turn-helix domain-containing protein [Hymenobacter sp. HSC-4F20]
MFSAARIATIRKRKGLSQEVLAEQSGVSLRTIQRVEQGETMPRGYTLQALATALDVPLDSFRTEEVAAPEPAVVPVPVTTPDAPAPTPSLRPDPDFLQLLNLSALSFLVLPLLNILVPWWLWKTRRHTIAHAAEVGRRVLGFQVLWQVGSSLAFLVVVMVQLLLAGTHRTLMPGLYLVVLVLTYALNVLVIGYNAWQLRQGRLNVYPIHL